MKVLMAHKFFYRRGGAEVFFLEAGSILERRGHEVAYFSTRHPENHPTPYADYFVETPDYLHGNILKRALKIGELVYSRPAKRHFKRLLDDFRPDLVHAFHINTHLTPSILVAAAEAGVPVVMTCNDYKHICPNYKLYHHGRICEDCRGGRFYHAVRNRCCQNSFAFSLASCLEAYAHRWLKIYSKYVHTYLFASDFMAAETEKFWGEGTFRWKKLLNPLDGPGPAPDGAIDNYIFYFGRLVEEKGVDILIEAMQYLPEISLKVLGEGPEEASLRSSVRRRGLRNVEFLEPRWGEYLHRVLNRCRFVVLPSSWHENLPYTILHAFSSGKAVIGTDRGGVPELVKDGEFGLLSPATDGRALAARIEELWNDPRRADSMGEAARRYVGEQFREEKFYNDLMAVYREVLG